MSSLKKTSLPERQSSLSSKTIKTNIPKSTSKQNTTLINNKINDSNNSSFAASDDSNLSTIKSVSSVSFSSIKSNTITDCTLLNEQTTNITRSNSTSFNTNLNNSHNNNKSIRDNNNKSDNYKSNASEDLIKKIEDLVSRNKTLEEENNVFRNLIHEESRKSVNCDERRILMLKCQIYQLEKQINILSGSLSFRKNAHTDAFNTLSYLADSFRAVSQNSESRNLISPTTYSIDKNEFLRWIELAESSKIKLAKTEDDYDRNDKAEPLLFDSNYSKTQSSILEVCSGNLNHINIKHVALLESNLSQLFKKLVRLKESLKTVRNLSQNESKLNTSKSSTQASKKNSELLPLHKENSKTQLDESIALVSQCSNNLFDLALLVPSAPWNAIKKSPIEELTQESLMNKLKSIGLPKIKHQSIEILVKSYFVASNYHFHMKSLECSAFNEEIKFYRSCYSLQKTYIESVMDLFKTKYEQFIQEMRDNLNNPLRTLIDKFWLMKSESTEDNLKDFLNLFKAYANKLDKVLASFDSIPNSDLITSTFNQLILQLDDEIAKLNSSCLNNLEKINLSSIDLNELSKESDHLLTDYLKPTPDSSPNLTRSNSIDNLSN